MAKIGFVLAASAAASIVAPVTWAQTPGDVGRTCAASDVRASTIIEDEGPRVSGAALDAAFGALVKARGACAEGRHPEGLALYNTITLMSEKVAPAATASRD